MNATAPDYPAGVFESVQDYDVGVKTLLTERIRLAPTKLREAVSGLSDNQLGTLYKNWTIRQITHHIADSHLHSIIRFKWALKPQGRMAVEFGGHGNVRHLSSAIESVAQSFLGEPLPHPWYFPGIAEFSSLLEQHGMEVTQAAVIDRPTALEGKDGLRIRKDRFLVFVPSCQPACSQRRS